MTSARAFGLVREPEVELLETGLQEFLFLGSQPAPGPVLEQVQKIDQSAGQPEVFRRGSGDGVSDDAQLDEGLGVKREDNRAEIERRQELLRRPGFGAGRIVRRPPGRTAMTSRKASAVSRRALLRSAAVASAATLACAPATPAAQAAPRARSADGKWTRIRRVVTSEDAAGKGVSAGVYLLRLETDGFNSTRKLILER